jgi:hypothetical protein
MAIANGLYAGQGASFPRVGFRYPTALYEGPYDVLRWAHKALGHTAESAAAAEQFERAKKSREAAHTTSA